MAKKKTKSTIKDVFGIKAISTIDVSVVSSEVVSQFGETNVYPVTAKLDDAAISGDAVSFDVAVSALPVGHTIIMDPVSAQYDGNPDYTIVSSVIHTVSDDADYETPFDATISAFTDTITGEAVMNISTTPYQIEDNPWWEASLPGETADETRRRLYEEGII